MTQVAQQIASLTAAIATLESQRAALGEQVVDLALASLRQQLAALRTTPTMEGERKLVTVIFADISGFTALSEKIDPEQVRGLMNACFESLVPVIERYDGTIDKFMGDEIMALFGAPMAHENDAERALRAALAMMDVLADFNREHHTDLGLHFGINTGPVVAGGIGSQGRQQYSVMGDTVNLAARLEDASDRGEIFVGPATFRLTEALFAFDQLPPIVLKGKVDPVAVYRLRGVRKQSDTRGFHGLRAPLVGRDAELATLHAAIERVAGGAGGVLTILGEPGLGKSRLVAETRQRTITAVGWAEGRALSYTETMSYWVARSVLQNLLGAPADAAPAELEAPLRARVAVAHPGQEAEIYPYLARLLDIPLDGAMAERVIYLSAEALQRRIRDAYTVCVRVAALERPLVLVWEDLHWADPSSLALLESLVPLTGEVPLLLVLVLRPEEGPGLELNRRLLTRPGYLTITLAPLDRAESIQLIQGLLHIDQFPAAIRTLILDKAEGNPFFLEELLRVLIEAGAVVLRESQVIASDTINQLALPDTLQGVIAARIDRLAPEHKRVLQAAAVIGRVFAERVLAHLNERAMLGEPVAPALAELLRREFIRQTDPQDEEYIFKHAVTQEVAYESLLQARRRELHRVVGEVIEALFPERLDELAATLAYHYERADDDERAIRYLARAAERARATYANAEATAFYRAVIVRAERHAGATIQLAMLCEGLGDVLALSGQRNEAQASYRAAHVHLRVNDRIAWARIQRKLSNSWMLQRQFDQAIGESEAAEQALQAAPDEENQAWQVELIQTWLDRMQVLYFANRVEELILLDQRVQAFVERNAPPHLRAQYMVQQMFLALGVYRYVIPNDVMAPVERAFTAIVATETLGSTAFLRFVMGFAYLWRGDLDDTARHFLAALEGVQRTGDITTESRTQAYLAVLHRRRGDLNAVRACVPRSTTVAQAAGLVEYTGHAHANLAWLAWHEGNSAEARNQAGAALAIWGQLPPGHASAAFQWLAHFPLMAVELAEGRLAEALAQAGPLLATTQMRLPEPLEQALIRAIAAGQVGDAQQATTELNEAINLARKLRFL